MDDWCNVDVQRADLQYCQLYVPKFNSDQRIESLVGPWEFWQPMLRHSP
jgi:hypothetical protein